MGFPKKATEASLRRIARIKEEKRIAGDKFRYRVMDDAIFVSDAYEELLEKTNALFLEAIYETDIFPTEIGRPYRHRIKSSGVNSIKLSRKIELINNYILEYYD